MTLTEEQRAALKRVVAYMDEMYAIASPYYGCTEDADLLRAMIDGSEQFSDASKMIGFDLERARGLRDFLQDDCAEVGDVWAEMIAEIERLQGFETAARDLNNDLTRIAGERDDLAAQIQEMQTELVRVNQLREIEIDQVGAAFDEADSLAGYCEELENIVITKDARIKALKADLEQSEICIQARLDVIDQQAARIKSLKKEIRRLKHESKVEQEFTNSYIKRLHDAEARIKELGSSLDEAEALTKKNAELMNGYLRRIAELEDALRDAIQPGDADKIDTFLRDCMCPDSEGPNECCMCPEDTIEFCDLLKRVRVASQQLQADGKIGPGARPPCWQITEERMRAITWAEEMAGDCNVGDVLRAMLEEGE